MVSQLITNSTNNVTSIYGLFQYIHEDVSSLFFPMILFAIYIISFIILKGFSEENSKAFAGTTFFCMIISVLLRAIGFLSNSYMYISISLVAISVVWLHLERGRYQ